jgi:hypothetical protein
MWRGHRPSAIMSPWGTHTLIDSAILWSWAAQQETTSLSEKWERLDVEPRPVEEGVYDINLCEANKDDV